ncbi:BolA family protein [Acidocella sp.]|uniref:BolA family protein n=1 Tax=Acidocella sp. TaxID=50710 RepID=UPI003CFF82A9
MTNRVERIKTALETAFQPSLLEVDDESRRHARHAERNDVPVGETHYRVRMVAKAFAGQNRLARQRAVNEALAGEFSTGLHALSLTLSAPEETA